MVLPGFAAPGDVMFGPAEMGGPYLVRVGTIPPGPGPDVHVHPYTDEAFVVAEGELTLHLAGREVVLRAGGFVFIPRSVPHTAWTPATGSCAGSSSSPRATRSTSSPLRPGRRDACGHVIVGPAAK